MSNSQENLIENENSKYWRSLDHKADTPEFREFIDKEFPSGVDLIDDPVSRRNFLKIKFILQRDLYLMLLIIAVLMI